MTAAGQPAGLMAAVSVGGIVSKDTHALEPSCGKVRTCGDGLRHYRGRNIVTTLIAHSHSQFRRSEAEQQLSPKRAPSIGAQ